jgi:Cd2+/Zn2+-exporting ATPase
LLLVLFSLGHALEGYAMGRARRAIEALGDLAPDRARVRRDGVETEVGVDDLHIGDTVLVRPGEKIPADGFVITGSSAVNQAALTGESVPVDKMPVADAARAATAPDDVASTNRVFAGTMNGPGALELYVTRLARETTMAKVVQLVRDAEVQTSPTQRFTQRFERVFVPAVLVTVVLLLFASLVVDEPFSDSFYRAMAVLVAASPCALAIATPSAVLSALGRAARDGVLVKGGGPLEALGRIRTIAFDKTGTLTEGTPRVTDVQPATGATEEELLETLVAVEKESDHPLAVAIHRDATARLGGRTVPGATGLKNHVGRGLEAVVDGDMVLAGNDVLFGERDIALPADVRAACDELRDRGRSIVLVRRGDRWLGVIGLMDTLRADSVATVIALRRLGVDHQVLLSGDHQAAATAIAQEAGLDRAIGDLLPDEKVAAVTELKAGGRVAMVGDGINDAPALAHADVGIAMGAAGSDVALETADVALMGDRVAGLALAVGLGRASARVIRQNLALSLGVVAVLVPATIFSFVGIGGAVGLHEGSTLLVVVNALRLLAWRHR